MSETNTPQPDEPGTTPQPGRTDEPAHEPTQEYNTSSQSTNTPVSTPQGQESETLGTLAGQPQPAPTGQPQPVPIVQPQPAPTVQPQQSAPWSSPAPLGASPNPNTPPQTPYAAGYQATQQTPQQPGYQAPNPYQGAYPGSAPYGVGSAGAVAVAPPLNKPYYGIGFPEAVSRFFKKYSVFSGRASRGEFWWVYLLMVLANILITILSGLSGVFGSVFGTVVGVIWTLATIVPMLSLSVRRLHDTNKGWVWILLPVIPMAIATVISAIMSFSIAITPYYYAPNSVFVARQGLTALSGILALIGVIASIVLYVAPSDPAGIRFDDDFHAGSQFTTGQYPQGGSPYPQAGATYPQTGGFPQQGSPQAPASYPQQIQYPAPGSSVPGQTAPQAPQAPQAPPTQYPGQPQQYQPPYGGNQQGV